MDVSGGDIEQATFDRRADGGFDPDQVRAYLSTVAVHVTELEQRAADAVALRSAAAELVEQAESLVEQAQQRADAAAADADRAAARVIAEAEATASAVEEAAQERARAVESEAAAALERSRVEAASMVAEAERDARALADAALSERAGPTIEAFAAAMQRVDDLRRDAERTLELAHVEATTVVARAVEEADRVLLQAAPLGGDEGRFEVDRIVAEAELLLEEARGKAASIIADATVHAEDLRTRRDLSAEIHRAIAALQAVTEARSVPDDSGVIGEVRGRAVRMLAELRRSDGRLSPSIRADLLDELFEVQDIIKRVEARLIGRDEDDAGIDRVVVDLTDEASTDDTSIATRPSRYQQRSANLPKIGRDVEDVSRAVRSIREQLRDDEE